jgi:autotransporter-associated beta strand protein
VINDGTFATNGNNITIGSLQLGAGAAPNISSGSGVVTLGGNVTLAPSGTVTAATNISANFNLGGAVRTFFGNGITLSSNADYSFTGIISGTGGIIIDSTAGTGAAWFAFTGANTFTGTFTIPSTMAGDVYFAATNTLGTGVALILNGTNFTSLNPTFTNIGVTSGSYSQSIGSLAGTASLSLGSATLTTGNDGTSTTYSGILSGTGGALIKTGSGTFTLTGANTYTGNTTVLPGATAGGGLTFTGTGSATSAGALTIGNGGAFVPTLTFDNSTTNLSVRYSTTAAVSLNNGAIVLVGSTAGTTQTLGALSVTTNSTSNSGVETDPFNPGDHAATPTSVNPIRESSGSLTAGRFGCVDTPA